MKKRWIWLTGVFTAVSLLGVVNVRHASAAPLPNDNAIIVKMVSSKSSGITWDVTLPPGRLDHIQEQAWLVVDGKSEGLGGDDIPPREFLKGNPKSIRLYANIDDTLDGQVKDILKGQGLPVKETETTYRVHYGAGNPEEGYNFHTTLHFRNSSGMLANQYAWERPLKTYKVGERITLYDGVALDEAEVTNKPFDMNDPYHRLKPGIPVDMAHHILIQVQFFPTDPKGRLITGPEPK